MTTQRIVCAKQINDPDFGTLKYHISNKDRVLWSFPFTFLKNSVLIYMDGNQEELDPTLKKLFFQLVANERILRIEMIHALKEFMAIEMNTFDERIEIAEISIWTKNYDFTVIDTIEKHSYVINFEDLKVQDILTE